MCSCLMQENKDPEAVRRRAMQDPEIQQIIADPAMQLILQQMQKDPQALREYVSLSLSVLSLWETSARLNSCSWAQCICPRYGLVSLLCRWMATVLIITRMVYSDSVCCGVVKTCVGSEWN